MTSVTNWPFPEVVRNSRSFIDEKPLRDEESLKEDVLTKGDTTLVVGSTDLFDEYGQIRLIPVSCDTEPIVSQHMLIYEQDA